MVDLEYRGPWAKKQLSFNGYPYSLIYLHAHLHWHQVTSLSPSGNHGVPAVFWIYKDSLTFFHCSLLTFHCSSGVIGNIIGNDSSLKSQKAKSQIRHSYRSHALTDIWCKLQMYLHTQERQLLHNPPIVVNSCLLTVWVDPSMNKSHVQWFTLLCEFPKVRHFMYS